MRDGELSTVPALPDIPDIQHSQKPTLSHLNSNLGTGSAGRGPWIRGDQLSWWKTTPLKRETFFLVFYHITGWWLRTPAGFSQAVVEAMPSWANYAHQAQWNDESSFSKLLMLSHHKNGHGWQQKRPLRAKIAPKGGCQKWQLLLIISLRTTAQHTHTHTFLSETPEVSILWLRACSPAIHRKICCKKRRHPMLRHLWGKAKLKSQKRNLGTEVLGEGRIGRE